MNSFEAKSTKIASNYLQEKLNLVKSGTNTAKNKNVYILEDKKETMFQRSVGSIFTK